MKPEQRRVNQVNRPETGPMQFPGELMPGLYFNRQDMCDFLRFIALADDQLDEMADNGSESLKRDVENVRNTLSALRGFLNRPDITPPQRARLEE